MHRSEVTSLRKAICWYLLTSSGSHCGRFKWHSVAYKIPENAGAIAWGSGQQAVVGHTCHTSVLMYCLCPFRTALPKIFSI